MYELRYYQKNAVEAGLNFLQGKHNGGLIILPIGAGKSLVIAAIANALKSPLLVLQPSKEILEQNFKKLTDFQYFDCGIYSASFSRKDVKMVTFATIGSIVNKILSAIISKKLKNCYTNKKTLKKNSLVTCIVTASHLKVAQKWTFKKATKSR